MALDPELFTTDLTIRTSADGLCAQIATGLEAAGLRADVVAVLRETIFADEDAEAATATVLQRLLDLPESV